MEKDENVKENETINESEITIENTEGETSNIQIADDVVAIIAGKSCIRCTWSICNGWWICWRNFRSFKW